MNFIDAELGGHEVHVRPGFLKQKITIDGKRVPKKYLKFHFSLISIQSTEMSFGAENASVETISADRDKIYLQDGQIFVNGHELGL